MKVTGKLITSYLGIAVVVLILGFIATTGLKTMDENAESMYSNQVVPLNELSSIIHLAESTRVYMVTSVLNRDVSLTEKAEQNLTEIESFITAYGETEMVPEEQQAFEAFQSSWDGFAAVVRSNIALIQDERFQQAKEGLAKGGVPYEEASGYLNELTNINEMVAKETEEANRNSYAFNRLLIDTASIAAVILAVGLGIYMGRSIGKPLQKVSGRMNEMTEGDLAGEFIEINRKDEIGDLALSVNLMQQSLKEVIRNVATASDSLTGQSEELTQSANEVKNGSEQVAVTMQELASGSEAQATSATDLADVMEALTAQMEEANGNGKNIYQSSHQVMEMTTNGTKMMDASVQQMAVIDQIVQEAVQKVKGLDAQSQEISKLVSVIKDIADQTNLLALNAAIEAARAGEHGKGFAVVADEVRKLAEQVGVSVTDITKIVRNIQTESTGVATSLQGGYEEVEKGTISIKATGETFSGINQAVKDMVSSIQAVTSNLEMISSGTQEASASVEEIASVSEQAAAGVEQTSAAAQQTSSSMEEVAGSAEELAKLAEELNGLVRQFKI